MEARTVLFQADGVQFARWNSYYNALRVRAEIALNHEHIHREQLHRYLDTESVFQLKTG